MKMSCAGDVRCTSYFIEPVQWMEQALLGVMDGQVTHTRRKSKLNRTNSTKVNKTPTQPGLGGNIVPSTAQHMFNVDPSVALLFKLKLKLSLSS